MSRPDESARIEAHAERFPEPVSSVDAILDGLREQATRPDDRSITRFDPFVSLADAEAAVHAAYEAGREADAPDAVKEIYAEYEREATRAVRLERERDAAADARTRETAEWLHSDEAYEAVEAGGIRRLAVVLARRFPNEGTPA